MQTKNMKIVEIFEKIELSFDMKTTNLNKIHNENFLAENLFYFI